MKGMVAEKLLPYPCLMREEGTGEERVFIYPSREREEGTGEERLFIYPSREQLAYKMPEVSDLQVRNFPNLYTFRHGSPKLIERICCFSSNVCYSIDS